MRSLQEYEVFLAKSDKFNMLSLYYLDTKGSPKNPLLLQREKESLTSKN